MSHHPKSPYLFLALTIMQAIHSAEEIAGRLYVNFPIVTGYIHSKIQLFPVLTMGSSTFLIANIIFVAFLALITAFLFRQNRWATIMARAIAIIEILNGAAHLIAAIYTKGYFPGSISALGLLILAILFLKSSLPRRGLIHQTLSCSSLNHTIT